MVPLKLSMFLLLFLHREVVVTEKSSSTTNQDDPNDTFVIKNLRKSGNTKDITRKVKANTIYDVQAIAGARSGDDPEDGTRIAIEYKGLNDRNLTKRDTIKLQE